MHLADIQSCRECGATIVRGPLPGDSGVVGWYHLMTRSELCGSVNDDTDDRVAAP